MPQESTDRQRQREEIKKKGKRKGNYRCKERLVSSARFRGKVLVSESGNALISMKALAISVVRVELLHPRARGRMAGMIVNQRSYYREKKEVLDWFHVKCQRW